MKKVPPITKLGKAATPKSGDLTTLMTDLRLLIQSARRGVASMVDTIQVMTNFEIGRRIVEHEQKGAKRAAYGAEVLKELSARLTEEFGRGFSVSNLQFMRQFYLEFSPRIQQTPSVKSTATQKHQTLSGELAPLEIWRQPTAKSGHPFTLSWSHYIELLGIKNPDERSFYEIESANSGWNVRELRRQKASCLYERLALSRDKAGIKRLAREGQVLTKPEDLFKEPLVLEFLGLEDRPGYSESDLESSLISHLENSTRRWTMDLAA